MLSAVLVQQFWTASWNISETHHYLWMFIGDTLRHSCLLVINSCNVVAQQGPCDCCIIINRHKISRLLHKLWVVPGIRCATPRCCCSVETWCSPPAPPPWSGIAQLVEAWQERPFRDGHSPAADFASCCRPVAACTRRRCHCRSELQW